MNWIQMVPVLVGGLLAIAGGIAGQFLTHYLDSKKVEKALRREKAEELVRALYAHAAWLNEKEQFLFRQQSHDALSPLDQARMLQKLYFPSMAEPILGVMRAQMPMIDFLGKQRIAQMADRDAWIKQWDPKPFHEAYKAYITALDDAVSAMRLILEADK